MIWEEEGHHIFINHEKEVQIYLLFKLGTSQNLDLVLLLLFSKEISVQDLQHKGMITKAKVGERELQFLQHNKAKIQVSSHGPPYLYLYAL